MSTYDTFDEQKKFACRVIADHARATAFSIADGILPGNEGRNYVLRKIMRRAIYQGRHALGLEDAFFYKVTNFVVDQMGEAYPELEASREFVEKMVKLEEERFGATMTVGLQKLDELFAQTKSSQTPGYAALARLYDTFGTPRDLIRVVLEEHGFPLDEDDFNKQFDAALKEIQSKVGDILKQTKKIYGISDSAIWDLVLKDGSERTVQDFDDPTAEIDVAAVNIIQNHSKFRGYETTLVENARVVKIVSGAKKVESLVDGEEGEIVLNETPFYAESGGQVGDVGRLINPVAIAPGTDLNAPGSGESGMGVPPVNHAQDARATLFATVEDTHSPAQGLIVHKVKVEKGTLKVGDTVTAEVDVEKRDATRRNHTATHLMHAALREVLGTHVKQAGSVVAPNYLRFDFNHYQPLTGAEIEEIERLVNYHILRNEPVQTDELAIEEAMRSGAMALFGEKYGEKVRVLSIKGAEGIFSKELCGGTHVRATGDIGVFKITSDESIASGVRRIRAVTGVDAYERFREDEEIISQVTTNLRTSRAELPAMIGKLQDELKKARREADELKLKIATGASGSAASNGDDAREVAGVRVLTREASGLDSAGMRQLSDTLLARIKSGVVVIGRSNEGKASLIVRTSDDLTRKVPAGLVIKELAPIIGGKGGGKADMAEGGGNQPEKLAEALEASYGVIERMLAS
jgi:alanyl-tRNA synthetase